mmetsp:Transcript_6630/g.11553  ORF Transcript_6630/g.11553 Transcript_6630/m.11553 type:complete len:132 (+) Transcript_6630:558-953(+)
MYRSALRRVVDLYTLALQIGCGSHQAQAPAGPPLLPLLPKTEHQSEPPGPSTHGTPTSCRIPSCVFPNDQQGSLQEISQADKVPSMTSEEILEQSAGWYSGMLTNLDSVTPECPDVRPASHRGGAAKGLAG